MITMMTMVPFKTITRIEPMYITSPIQRIQELAISNRVIPIHLVPTMRPNTICPITFVLLPTVDLKWPLSLQF